MTDYPNEIARLDAQRRKNHDATAYEELDKAYTESGHTVFIMALNALISLGRDTVAAMAHPAAIAATIQGNIFSEDFKLEVGRIALMMANADIDVLLTVIQRIVVPFTDPQGKRIPFLHPNGDEEDVCPVCGAEVEYQGDREIDYNDGTEVSWECPVCKAFGKALYHDTFLQHEAVMDGNGDCVHDRV